MNQPIEETEPHPRSLDWILGLVLVLVTLVLYGRMSAHEFINLDDQLYITENAAVLEGLTMESARWALTSQHATNWHPLTWLSHMLDVSLFGLDAGAHHRTNAWLHALAALLCFLLLRALLRLGRDLRDLGPRSLGLCAFLGAAFFAWHPLRVESVAWVSERKDLLAAVFWFLSVLAYLRYARARSLARYLPIPVCLALSLASKPMAVTLPCLLLLLDIWPLCRPMGKELLLEKLPLFFLVVASCLVTIQAQGAGGAFDELEGLDFNHRLAGAFSAQATYLRQLFWPGELGFFYPHPGVLHPDGYAAWNGAALMGLALFGLLSAASLFWRKRLPWLALGWAWYLGMLVPVVGLLQVGGQAHADRYTYLPSIGIGLALCASVPLLLKGSGLALKLALAASLAFLLWLLPKTMDQVQTWKNSVSASSQSLLAAENNYVGHNNLGQALEQQGQPALALKQYMQALKLRPNHLELQLNAAHALIGMKNWRGAEKGLRNILNREPLFHGAQSDLGVLLARQKRSSEALPFLHSAWSATELPLSKRLSAGQALAWQLATAEPASLRDGAQAVQIMQLCMQLDTGWIAWNTLAAAQAQSGQFEQAAESQARALLDAPNPVQEDLKQRLALYRLGRNPN